MVRPIALAYLTLNCPTHRNRRAHVKQSRRICIELKKNQMKTLVTIAVLLIVNLCFSQHTIDGKILDSEKNPINAAAVSLLTFNEGSFVKAAITNENGTFKISNISNGDYK